MIRIATSALCAMLEDLVLTTASADSGNETASILLHSARGYRDPNEPGRADILVGTSTTTWSVGHDHVVAEGQLDEPMLWHRSDAASVVGVFKARAKEHQDHVVEISRFGETVVVQEQADLFGPGTHLEFKSRATAKFPRNLVEALQPPAGNLGLLSAAPSVRVDFGASQLDPFITIAKRRKSFLETYRYPGNSRILIQIGPRYRGLLTPVTLDDEIDQDPSNTVYPYRLPVVDDDEVTEKVMTAAAKDDPLPFPNDDDTPNQKADTPS